VDHPDAGIAYKKNLLGKCQQCHPDATTASFTDSWLAHYEPSPQVFPLVFFVNLFYKIFIPAVLGGMILFVLTDVYRRFIVPRRPVKEIKVEDMKAEDVDEEGEKGESEK
jgi:hypothetical protein